MAEGKTQIGNVTNFYSKISVAVVQLTAPVNVGDKILIKGDTTNFEQAIESMQIEHQNIPRAEAGQSIGLKVNDRVRPGDIVYR
jgi:putative protease